MTDAQIAFGLGLLVGMFLIALALFVSEVRNAQVVETMSPHTYQAIVEITAERSRQVGWLGGLEDQYSVGLMANTAGSYCFSAAKVASTGPTTARRDLIRAAALIVAEVEKIDRAAERQGGAA